MNRQQVIARDRVAMLKKALEKAGYLTAGTSGTSESDQTPDQFKEMTENILTDLLHLGATEYGIAELNTQVGQAVYGAARVLFASACDKATNNYLSERLVPQM